MAQRRPRLRPPRQRPRRQRGLRPGRRRPSAGRSRRFAPINNERRHLANDVKPGTRSRHQPTTYSARVKHNPWETVCSLQSNQLRLSSFQRAFTLLASPRPRIPPWLPSASPPCSSSLPLPSLPLRPGRCVLPWRCLPPTTRVTPSCRAPNRGSAPTSMANRGCASTTTAATRPCAKSTRSRAGRSAALATVGGRAVACG